jgi:hypothetical protein
MKIRTSRWQTDRQIDEVISVLEDLSGLFNGFEWRILMNTPSVPADSDDEF